MKRYKVTISLGISAKSKKEAKKILVEILEKGSIVADGRFMGLKVTDDTGIQVDELPF